MVVEHHDHLERLWEVWLERGHQDVVTSRRRSRCSSGSNDTVSFNVIWHGSKARLVRWCKACITSDWVAPPRSTIREDTRNPLDRRWLPIPDLASITVLELGAARCARGMPAVGRVASGGTGSRGNAFRRRCFAVLFLTSIITAGTAGLLAQLFRRYG